METKKFLDKNGAEVIAGKINLIAGVVSGLMDMNHIKIVTEAEFDDMLSSNLESNVQYNIVTEPPVDFGEIWVHNNLTGNNRFVSLSKLQTLDNSTYTPIGLVVIPASHNVYGDGTPGVMALKSARASDPDTGGPDENISWGTYGLDIPGLSNLTKAPVLKVNSDGSINHLELGTAAVMVYLPSDAFTGLSSSDGKSKYSGKTPYAPSPYLTGGPKNPLFFTQCFTDFNGRSNTNILLHYVTADEDWRTSATINNPGNSSDTGGRMPAACCCWRYHTAGTNQGDWYLPSCGELAYVCVRQKEINAIIAQINAWKAGSAIPVAPVWYWTSSEVSTYDARVVSLADGVTYNDAKYLWGLVRPFAQVTM